MKKTIAILVFTTALLACSEKNKKQDKSIKETVFQDVYNKSIKLKNLVKIISIKNYTTNSELEKTIVKEDTYYLSNTGLITNYSGCYYNKEKLSYKSNGEYLVKDKRLVIVKQNADDDIIGKQIYKFNNKGNHIISLSYNSSNRLMDKYTYEYDDDGNQIEEIMYGSDGSLWYKYVNEYNSKGNQTKLIRYNKNKDIVLKVVYKYDRQGNQNKITRYRPDGSIGLKFENKFDDNGNLIEQLKFNNKGVSLSEKTYKYEFDSYNNWTKQIEFLNDNAIRIIERDIEYY